ncbi:MAG: ribonuclease Y [Patescibacteria group bacterium]
MQQILLVVAALAVGLVGGWLIRLLVANNRSQSAEGRADKIIADAKVAEQTALLQAKQIVDQAKSEADFKGQKLLVEAREQSLAILSAAEGEKKAKEQDLKLALDRVSDREQRFDQTLLDFEGKKTEIEKKREELLLDKEKIGGLIKDAEEKLQQVAGLSKAEALEIMMKKIQEEKQDDLLSRIRKMDKESEETIEARARKIITLAIQRFASSQVVDATLSYVDLPSDDMKGRIIGREGRNIKAIEHQTGCELIIDDTPGSITISGFSPVRRQVARRALEILMKDGRIQPAKIEEAVKEAKNDLAKEMKKAGEDALYELGIPVTSIDPKLISILGRLKYRTSYGQNVLQHSIEVARIAGLIAEELGFDPFPLRKGGLFHDIGKAVDHDMQGAHPQIGYNVMKKFGFPEELCYQSIAHHEDMPRTIEGVIVKAADAISGARPGARRSSVEDYLQRLQNLETAAMSFAGVEKAYAIQAGREVRVFVTPTTVNDIQAFELARDVAKKIESELTYPGEVRVTVIRETRVTEVAR